MSTLATTTQADPKSPPLLAIPTAALELVETSAPTPAGPMAAPDAASTRPTSRPQTLQDIYETLRKTLCAWVLLRQFYLPSARGRGTPKTVGSRVADLHRGGASWSLGAAGVTPRMLETAEVNRPQATFGPQAAPGTDSSSQ